MSHHTEAFLDDNGGWGWQCFEPACGKEITGYADCHTAEVWADRHEQEHSDANIQSEMDRVEGLASPPLVPSWRFVVPEERPYETTLSDGDGDLG